MESADRSPSKVSGRGYGPDDLLILELFGVGATFASSLVLALYVQYESTSGRFNSPGLLWGIVPLVLLWSCRMWLSTTRGYMHHDPIMYALPRLGHLGDRRRHDPGRVGRAGRIATVLTSCGREDRCAD